MRSRTASFGVVILLSLLSTSALAHRFRHPKQVEIEVAAKNLRLTLRWESQPGRASERLRSVFDRNSDGVLDAKEQAAFVEAWSRRLWQWLEVKPLERTSFERVEAKVRGASSRPTRSLGLVLVYEAPRPPGSALALDLFDRTPDPKVDVPLTVRVYAPDRIEGTPGSRLQAWLRPGHRVPVKVLR